MLFTWDTTNLCIVFKQWHIRGTPSLIVSLLAVVVLCAGFEALRAFCSRYDTWTAQRAEELPRELAPLPSPLPAQPQAKGTEDNKKTHGRPATSNLRFPAPRGVAS